MMLMELLHGIHVQMPSVERPIVHCERRSNREGQNRKISILWILQYVGRVHSRVLAALDSYCDLAIV